MNTPIKAITGLQKNIFLTNYPIAKKNLNTELF